MVKLAIWLVSLMVIVFLAIHPALQFRLELQAGRRSVYLRGLTHEGTCMVLVARRQLPYL